jgi:hypothetical protein
MLRRVLTILYINLSYYLFRRKLLKFFLKPL